MNQNKEILKKPWEVQKNDALGTYPVGALAHGMHTAEHNEMQG